MNHKTKGSLMAAAVAGLFLAGTALSTGLSVAQTTSGDTGYCKAPNSCKGKGSCGVKGKHDCSGKNACSGQGWVKLKISKDDCMKVKDTSWDEGKKEKAS